jgi:hypothetical protein
MDLISARVLAKMPVVDPEYLYPLEIPTAIQFACQRGCKGLDRLEERITAVKNRLRDTDRFTWPGLESIFYHGQMVNKGNHHNQAVCACVTYLLDRARIILLRDRPYELRDVDGTPVTPEQDRAIIAERYTVPEEVRQRNNRRARKKRAEQRTERKWQRQRRRRKGSPPR